MDKIVRFCEEHGLEEVSDLKEGMDFRLPQYRREVFLRLYEFHLKYRTHPGLVYLLMPYLANKFNWDKEQKYWFAFINGCTQNPCTSWVIFNKFPDFMDVTEEELEKWHRANWKRLDYDIDRRYVKGHFVENFASYKKNLGKLSQTQFFEDGLCSTGDKYENFYNVWDKVMSDFFMFGRLSTFSYLEYLKIMGLNLDCPELFLEDLSGSKSHRNGLMKVTGRDDLDWHKDNPEITTHSKEIVNYAIDEGFKLLGDAKQRFKGRDFFHDVNFFTLESTLCCYKSHYRLNRRYPNVYTDMLFDRIKKAETHGWEAEGITFEVFWEARRMKIPPHLLLECNPKDVGINPVKQNHFRNTGEVPMMDLSWKCFRNQYNQTHSKVYEIPA
jgi:hypothetical protein